jgi:hypothetical protein
VRDFVPVRLGNAETDAWVNYYPRRWRPFPRASLTMVRVGFALYAHVYAVPAASVRDAAAGRSEAMVISDKWVADGQDPASPGIGDERAALVRGYRALREAVAG